MIELVAEFTTNHAGNLNLLLRMVEKAAKAGATAAKMQKKDVETYYSLAKLDAPFESPYGYTYRDYRTTFEFGHEDWARFDKHCRKVGIPWFSTIQDEASLDFVFQYLPNRYKIASSNARSLGFLKMVAEKVPVACGIVVSVGGSTLDEIGEVVEIFRNHRRLWLLHCVAEYPCPEDRLRLGNIVELGRCFGSDRVKIGYSGHELGWQASLAAVQLGAQMIERHFCLSRHSFVHHIECSLEPHEFARMGQDIRRKTKPLIAKEAYEKRFGMTDKEAKFLKEQTYSNECLGSGARM